MEILKVVLVMMAGLGSTWVARATTDALLGPSTASALVQATAAQPDATPPAAGPTPGSSPGPPVVPEMSREEMEAELERARAERGGARNEGDLREFRPTRPLAADLAIALPSDI